MLLMECAFFQNKPVEKHLELKDAMDMARISQPKKVVLSHLYSKHPLLASLHFLCAHSFFLLS